MAHTLEHLLVGLVYVDATIQILVHPGLHLRVQAHARVFGSSGCRRGGRMRFQIVVETRWRICIMLIILLLQIQMITLVCLMRSIRFIIPLPPLHKRSRPLTSSALPLILISLLRCRQHHLLLLGRQASVAIHLLAQMRPISRTHGLGVILRGVPVAGCFARRVLVLRVGSRRLVEE